MKKLTRRGFIKGLSVGALGAAAAGLTACSAPSSGAASTAAASGTYTPGTYSATAQGIGTVKVTMTFDAESITDVVLDVSGETESIGGAAADTLRDELLAAQNAEIDTVSGATVTSDAVKKAAEACIAQAKGESVVINQEIASDYEVPKGLTKEDVEGSSAILGEINPDQVLDYDVVVVGAGAAGVPAAGAAVLEGAKVALLQKQAVVVSQGNCIGAIIKSKSDPQGLLNFIHHTNSLCDWRADRDQIQTFIDYSEDAMNWVLESSGLTGGTNEEAGLSIYMQNDIVYHGVYTDRTTTFDYGDSTCYLSCPFLGPKPKNMGDVLQVSVDNLAAQYDNFDVYYKTPAVQLVVTDGKVTGVIAQDEDGKFIQFNASKGVILATGDYQNNDAMVEHFCPDTAPFDKKQYQKTGDGHVMAVAAGAKMEPVGHTKMLHDFDSGLMFEEPFLCVNMDGQRFTNEDVGFVYMNNILRREPIFNGDNVDANHPDGSKGWYCQIYDSDYMSYGNAPVAPEVMERYIPGVAEDTTGMVDYLLDTHRADTLKELAEMIDIDPTTLTATVERYNQLCEAGFDEDFGKNPAYLHPVKNGPFWAVRRHMRVSAICSGVEVNANGQALDENGNPIDGLYCVGNLSGTFYGGADYPYHATGLSLGRCAAFGWAAAKHACAK